MKQLSLLLAGIYIICSCQPNERSIKNSVEPTKDSISHSKAFDTSNILKLSLNEAVELYGKTTNNFLGHKDNEYVLGGLEENFDVMLNSIYTAEQKKSGKIIIKEMTWEIDSIYRITIWYEKMDSNKYIPKTYHIWATPPKLRQANYIDTIKRCQIVDLSKAMKLNSDDILNYYGETTKGYSGIKDYEYVLKGTWGINNNLNAIYTKEQMLNGEIVIKELTWRIDSIYRLTIWYEKNDSNKYIPKDYHIWNINSEF